MAFVTTVANQVLSKILKNQDFTPATALYVSLHTGDPGDTGTAEVTGGSYGRQSVTFGTAATKSISNTADITFTAMPVATITHVGIWSASTAGTFWWGGSLTASKTTASGDSFQIATGQLSVTLT